MARKAATSTKPPQSATVKAAKAAETKPLIDPHELAEWFKGALPGALAQHNKKGVMFTIGGKVFAFSRPAGIAIKLPETRIDELIECREASFLVMGTKTMREWVLLSYAIPGDYRKDGKLFEDAMKFAAAAKK